MQVASAGCHLPGAPAFPSVPSLGCPPPSQGAENRSISLDFRDYLLIFSTKLARSAPKTSVSQQPWRTLYQRKGKKGAIHCCLAWFWTFKISFHWNIFY